MRLLTLVAEVYPVALREARDRLAQRAADAARTRRTAGHAGA
ncbi:hypothetical protein [Nocardioides marmoraquaticus]